jgi:hypothetical protein
MLGYVQDTTACALPHRAPGIRGHAPEPETRFSKATMPTFLFDASGKPVGFLRGAFIHDMNGNAIGQLRGTHVYKLGGAYVGELYKDMVLDRHLGNLGNIGHPRDPGNPGHPGNPGNRGVIDYGYADVFAHLLEQ